MCSKRRGGLLANMLRRAADVERLEFVLAVAEVAEWSAFNDDDDGSSLVVVVMFFRQIGQVAC